MFPPHVCIDLWYKFHSIKYVLVQLDEGVELRQPGGRGWRRQFIKQLGLIVYMIYFWLVNI
jgi:hypothetical protein